MPDMPRTVLVTASHWEGPVLINESDFDASVHTKLGEEKPKPKRGRPRKAKVQEQS